MDGSHRALPLAAQTRKSRTGTKATKKRNIKSGNPARRRHGTFRTNGEKTMKTLAMVACLVLATLNVATAERASLPEIMLGRWCTISGEIPGQGSYDGIMDEQEWKKCLEGDGYLTVRRTGYSAHETECRFIAVRNTGRKSVPHTKSYPHEMVPIMRVVARCTQEDTKYKATFEMTYYKGTLSIESK
jgi:hypothetical protein